MAAQTMSPCTGRLAAGLARPPKALVQRAGVPTRRPALRSTVRARDAGQEAVGAWLDLASFVTSAGSGGRTPYDDLAEQIGRDVYIDVAGWHLYLKDVKVEKGLTLAQVLAAQLGPKLQAERRCSEDDVAALLRRVPVKLGGGKQTLALADVVPTRGVRDLERACEDYARSC